MVQKEAQSAGRARGRPRSFDPDQVLDRARAVFWNQGYAATSLDDLAAATGLNRPSLYAAFGDKRALYLAAMARSRDEALGAMAAALADDVPLRPLLDRILARSIEVYRAGEVAQRGCFLIGTAVTQAVEDAEIREMVADFIARSEALFRTRFETSAAELAPGVRPGPAASIVTATLHTLAIRARTGADGAELKRVADAAVEMVCGARTSE